VLQVALRVALLRVVLGIGGDLDVPVAPFLLADEGDQLAGVAELARGRGAARQVAAQGDQAADLLLPVGAEDLGDAFAGRADAGDVRRGGMAEGGDVGDGGERLVAGGAAGAVGDAEELGLAPRPAPGTTVFSFSLPTGVLGGKNSKLTGTGSCSVVDSSWGRPSLAGTHGVEKELARAFAAGRGAVEPVEHLEAVRRAALRRRFSAWP
jgi:hypothetical protein